MLYYEASMRLGFLTWIGALLWPLMGWALPLERFEVPIELNCQADTICSQVVRSRMTLGGSTGVTLNGGSQGMAKLLFKQGDVRGLWLRGQGEAINSLTLSWDGDAYPEQLSALGLRCLDLTAEGAQAFVIMDLNISLGCNNSEVGDVCPPYTIETRVYDADDATGQRYSASILSRSAAQSVHNLEIPFSDFTREGPRGLARFSCVGAVTIALHFEELRDVELSFGPIFTNGADGLIFIPTPTPTPTSTPLPSETPTSLVIETPPPLSYETVTALPSPSIVPEFDDNRALEASTPKPPKIRGIIAPRRKQFVPEHDAEVIYGAVVADD